MQSWDQVRRVRLKLGLSQDDFAKLFALSGPGVVSNIETGYRNPSKTMLMILDVLDSLPLSEAQSLMIKMQKSALKIGEMGQ